MSDRVVPEDVLHECIYAAGVALDDANHLMRVAVDATPWPTPHRAAVLFMAAEGWLRLLRVESIDNGPPSNVYVLTREGLAWYTRNTTKPRRAPK